jgi:hypothetical protein
VTIRRRALAAALLLATAGGCALAPTGSGYRFHARAWPDGVVPYYNEAPSQAGPLANAVQAWNTSGAHVRFVAVPREQAKLLIVEGGDAARCPEAKATLGYSREARLVVFPGNLLTASCNPYWSTLALAHELGHVLGLAHEERGCATMNPYGSMHGGSRCTPNDPWEWRCRILEPDDVAGAAAAYGGTPVPRRTPPTCPLYRAIAPPGGLSAVYDETRTALRLAFTRPSEPSVPAFVGSPTQRQQSAFVILVYGGECRTDVGATHARRYRWTVPPGGRERITQPIPAGPACVALWAADAIGRLDDSPVQVRIPRAGA